MKLLNKELVETPSSANHLVIVGMFTTLVILSIGLIILLSQEKDAMPLGALAGTIVGYFSTKRAQKDKTKCEVCGTSATYHTTEQCIRLVKTLKKEKL